MSANQKVESMVTPEMIEAGGKAIYESSANASWHSSWGDLDDMSRKTFELHARRSYLAMKALDPEVERLQEALNEALEMVLEATQSGNFDTERFEALNRLCAEAVQQ